MRWNGSQTEGEGGRTGKEHGRDRDCRAESDRRCDDPGDRRADDVPGEVRAENDPQGATELPSRCRGCDVRDDERQPRRPRPVQSRSDERAVPVRERHERRDPEGGAEPRRRDNGLAPDAVGEIAGGEKAEDREEVPGAEHDPDVLRACAEVPEIKGPHRREESEPAPEQHLRSRQDPDVARKLQLRPFTIPRARRSSNSARALRRTSGSASTSIAVSASAFAATSAFSCAS